MSKKRGRPKGSRNKKYEHATEIPAACMSCGSTDLVVVGGNIPVIRKIAGTLSTGQQYDRVRWDRKRCKNCGQLIAVRSYYNANNNCADIIPKATQEQQTPKMQ